MRALKPAVLSLVVALASPIAAQAAVAVSYDAPERFTDAYLDRDRDSKAREATLTGIRQYLETLGGRYLSNGQTLRIEVLDIDLAGHFSPVRASSNNVRIMGNVDWPRIKFRYTLEDGGRVVMRGEDTVTDMNYQARAEGRYTNDLLRYEKAMLDSWFRSRFGEPKQAKQ